MRLCRSSVDTSKAACYHSRSLTFLAIEILLGSVLLCYDRYPVRKNLELSERELSDELPVAVNVIPCYGLQSLLHHSILFRFSDIKL